MNKIKIGKKKKDKYVYTKLLPTQSLNQREIELLGRRQIRELITPQIMMSKKPEIMYNVSNIMSLKEHLSSVTSKAEFVRVILSILDMMKEAQQKMLYMSNFVFDSEYIFVEPSTKELRYIYLPISNYDPEYNIRTMLLSLAYDTVFNHLEDCSYVSAYISYFNTHSNFSVYDFEMFVRQMNGEIISAYDKEVNTAHPSKLLKKEAKICPKCNETFMSSDNFCEKCGERLVYPANSQQSTDEAVRMEPQAAQMMQPQPMQMMQPQPMQMMQSQPMQQIQPQPQPMQQVQMAQPQPVMQPSMGTTVLGVVEAGTTVLSPQELGESIVYPYLVRKNTGDKIYVNSPEFYIGQGSMADYMVTGNTAISRKHAGIITREGRYYIIDNNSTNGTYIDDVKIIPAKETEIVAGQRLRLANEEYEFLV